MLLRFRVANHRSLRDESEVSLIAPGFGGTVPPDGDWLSATNRVTGIYGANGSGKSTVLDALDFMRSAVVHSATSWGERESFPYQPFLLDETWMARPSLYELDFLSKGVRYSYGFESTDHGIRREWLYSYPSRRRRVLFERSEDSAFSFGRTFQGENQTIAKLTGKLSLFLSVAANSNHSFLKEIRSYFTGKLRYARYNDFDRQDRMQWMKQHLLQDDRFLRQIGSLMKFADLGISQVEVRRETLSEEHRASALAVFRDFRPGIAELDQSEIDRFFEAYQNKIRFFHYSKGYAEGRSFSLEQESGGTVAWLSLIGPALHSLRFGETFIVDELDASLHPKLSAALIQLYKDPVLNPSGAQLLFTSHDTSLLGRLLGPALSRGEVWFTEKNLDGSTSLYALEEFITRDGDNIEKRYLDGRYGALPTFDPEDLRSALVESNG